MNKVIANFINHETAMMSSVQRKQDDTFIVHLADLDSDSRVPPSRIFKDADVATKYAEFVVGKGGVKC
jgi:hypothetical protein